MSAIPFTAEEIELLNANAFELDNDNTACDSLFKISKRSIGFCLSTWYDDDEEGHWSDADVYPTLKEAIEG